MFIRFFSPRGLAGALLVIKVAGALAEQGKNMSEIVDICQNVRGQLRTIGLSASGIRAPGQQQSFQVNMTIFFQERKMNVFSRSFSYLMMKWSLEWVFMVKVVFKN
jgi:hypothetical protein